MIAGGSASLLWTAAVYIVGAEAPGYARGIGLAPVSTFDEAVKAANRHIVKNPRILCTRECLSGSVAVHLHGGH